MSKKLYTAFVPLFAVAAFAVMPAVAQAQPHWYRNGTIIKAGKTVKVTTHSVLPGLDFKALGVTITCKVVTDKGTVTNPTSGGAGYDNITNFVNKECTATPASPCKTGETLELTALKGEEPLTAENEWPSTLLAGPPIRDEIREIEIWIECNKAGTKTVLDTFTGTLTPKIVNGTTGTEAGCAAGTDTVAEFDEPGSGFLLDPAGNKGFPSGKDCFWGSVAGEVITVKNP